MANKTTKTKKNSATSSSKQSTSAEMREWYEKHKKTIENFERSQDVLQLLDPTSTSVKTFSTFSKETLRTYMKNPLTNYKNLRNLSRFLYYRSHTYRRLIQYNAQMPDLNYRSVVPLTNLTKGHDKNKSLKRYYETLMLLQNMNLALEFLKVYTICWREDLFFGCSYLDEEGFFLLPLDSDYCTVTGFYKDGSLAFDMNMTYFDRKQDILEMWGEPFTSMYAEYQKDTINGKWQPMPDEYSVCLKLNIDDWSVPLPPFMAIFDSLISLEDMKDLNMIAEEQQIYRLLALKIPLLKNSNEIDDFAVDPKTAISYYNKIVDSLPDYTNAILMPGLDVEAIKFDSDQAADVNRLENATKSVLNISGGSQVLTASLAGSNGTAWKGAIKADEENALSSLLPQTQAVVNRLISYKIKDHAIVKFLEVTKFSKQEYADLLMKEMNYGLPIKLTLGSLNGFTELETISMAYLEHDLDLNNLFVTLQTSSTTSNTGSGSAGAPEKSDVEITDDGEASRDKRETNPQD